MFEIASFCAQQSCRAITPRGVDIALVVHLSGPVSACSRARALPGRPLLGGGETITQSVMTVSPAA
jgi:hypothetical protein